MIADELRARVADLSVWTRGDERAPYKPLLLLWALGRLVRGEDRLTSYALVDEELRPIFSEFGPPRATYRTHYPFWYLRNDGLWEVTDEARLVAEARGNEPSRRTLLDADAAGGLTPDAFELLRAHPTLVREVAATLLGAHFEPSYFDDILDAVGLDLMSVALGFGRVDAVSEVFDTISRRRRDPRFRNGVLVAYEYRCAFCGFDARIESKPVGVEAAHIKWHQARGPDVVANGFALCALHHKLFDRGALTVAENGAIALSRRASGGPTTDTWLRGVVGQVPSYPLSADDRPAGEFLAWHRREVFRGG